MEVLVENILDLIPQRPPFVMVDHLLSYTDTTTRSSFVPKQGNVLVEDGKFTAPGLLENIAQTAAARAGYTAGLNQQPVAIGYIGAVKSFEVLSLPSVNETLQTEVTVTHQVLNVTVVNGKIWSGETLLAQCELKIFISQHK